MGYESPYVHILHIIGIPRTLGLSYILSGCVCFTLFQFGNILEVSPRLLRILKSFYVNNELTTLVIPSKVPPNP